MKFTTTQMGAMLALVSGRLVHGWNATIYDSANCTGNRYEIYPTAEHTKYFEMKGSWGAEMSCTFHGRNGTAGPCKEQFPVGKSVFSNVGLCRSYSGGHSSGDHEASQGEDECGSPSFDILSVVCYDA